MAQTGFTPIVTYNTATATTVPSAANLAQGELAVNVTDKKLYTKDSGGNVVLLASNGGDVTGPASSTNLAIPTFSGTGGKTLLNNSGVTISAGVVSGTGFTGALNGTLGATTPSTAVVTSINKMAITAPATSSTLAVADGKTLTANKTLTLTGTDSTTMTFPTTSATIARTDAGQTFTGEQLISGGSLGFSSLNTTSYIYTNDNNTGTGSLILQAGAGSAAFGGGYSLFGNAHATYPGWTMAGISSGSGGKFAVNDQAVLGGGANVFTVDGSGVVVANGTISPQQATTAAAPAYVKGAIYFDTTLNKMRIGGATGWETVTSV